MEREPIAKGEGSGPSKANPFMAMPNKSSQRHNDEIIIYAVSGSLSSHLAVLYVRAFCSS